MNGSVREISVGAAVLAALLVLTVIIYNSDDSDAAASDAYNVVASFNRVDGLAEGDPVFVSGVRVGFVEKMFLNENFRAVTRLRIENGVPIPKDSSAAIHTDGLFGPKYVVLEPGGEIDPLKEGDTIVLTQDAVIVSDLLDLIIAEGKSKLGANAPKKAD